MIEVLDKKTYFRSPGSFETPIDEAVKKALEPKPSPIEEGYKTYGFDDQDDL